MSGILRLESLTKGNTLKQGDKTPLKYRLFDADGEKLTIAGKTAKVRLVYPDFLTIGYEKDGLTVAQDDTVTFTIDGVIPSRIYHVEIIVDDKFIFPSRADESKFTVDKSSLGTEANIIEIVGVDAVVRKAVDLINEDPSLIIDEDKLVTDIISNTGIGSINDYYKAFDDLKPRAELSISKSAEALTKSQNALNVANGIDAKATNALSLSESADTLSKSVQEQFNQVVIDGDSSVEAAQARVDASGQTNPTLKSRLDKEHNEVTAQLAQKADQDIVDGLDGRIDNLVLQSGGDSNIEVADSRHSVIKNTTFSTIGQRLEANEEDLKEGLMPVENGVSDGGMAEGVTHYVPYPTRYALTASNNVLKATVADTGNGTVGAYTPFVHNAGDLIFVKSGIRTSADGFTVKLLSRNSAIPTSGAVASEILTHKRLTTTDFYEYTGIIKGTATSSHFEINVGATLLDGQSVEFENIMAINLTKTFGYGKEPALDKINELLSKYTNRFFKGTVYDFININELDSRKVDKLEFDNLKNDYEQVGYLAKNKIENGNFEKNYSDWTGYFADASVEEEKLKVIVSQSGARIHYNFDGKINHKYYISFQTEIPEYTKFKEMPVFLSDTVSGSGNSSVVTINEPPQRFSMILNGYLDGLNVLRIHLDKKTEYVSEKTVVYFDNTMMLDLTEIFGEGLEPNVAEVDQLLSKYDNNWFSETTSLLSIKDIDSRVKALEDAKDEPFIPNPNPADTSKKPYDFSILPINGNGYRMYNGTSFMQDNLTTFNNHQYATWWSYDKRPIIGKRKLPYGDWETFDLSTVPDNPLQSPVVDDGHNNIVVAVSNDGYIHVVGNHHGYALRYVRSVNPEDISSFEGATMTGSDTVTYPTFVKLKNGELLFFFREGSSESGKTNINAYGDGTRTWVRRKTGFIDGIITSDHGYLNHIAVDRFGTIHVGGTWRATPQANTNRHIFYAKSEDGGYSWKRSDGTMLPDPITINNCEIILETPETDSGIINQFGLEVDYSGNPHIAYFRYDDEGNTNIFHIYHNGESWVDERVTDLKVRLDTTSGEWPSLLSRPSILTHGDRVFIIYRVNYTDKKGSLRLIEVTPNKDRYDFPIVDIDFNNFEPTFDTQRLHTKNELSVLLIANHANAVLINTEDFTNQPVYVYTIDLNQIDDFRNGKIDLPTIKPIKYLSYEVDVNKYGDFVLNGGLPVPVPTESKKYYGKLDFGGDVGGAGTITSVMKLNGKNRGKSKTTGVNTSSSTGWVHLDEGGVLEISGNLDGLGNSAKGYYGLEIGEIDF